jgi:molecular chaperone DnaK (HSP70)
MDFSKEIWSGEDKIVVGIDFGATQSSVTYLILTKGATSNLQRVKQWPGVSSSEKVPSLILYDSNGKPRFYGTEVLLPENQSVATKENWEVAKHFKLHLHPKSVKDENNIKIPSLPLNTTLSKILRDWFRFLDTCTTVFFSERDVRGKKFWDAARQKGSMEFVICHPNGWEPAQQNTLRTAAVEANLVPKEHAEKICFLTEAEASVHYFLAQERSPAKFKNKEVFVLCDAGGSTVDTTLYQVMQTQPRLKLEEQRTSACIQAGGLHVTEDATEYLREVLSRAFQGDDLEANVQEGTERFEWQGKRRFTGEGNKDVILKIGTATASDINLQRGFLPVTSEQMKKLFEPWIKKIIQSIKDQIQGHEPTQLILVGGFGDSPYLRKRLQSEFKNLKVVLKNDSSSEVVSDGAVIWRGSDFVSARASRFTYGVAKQCVYQSSNAMHVDRKTIKRKGGNIISGVWDPLIKKDEIRNQGFEVQRPLWNSYSSRKVDLSQVELALYAYMTNTEEEPYFVLNENGDICDNFAQICVIKADMDGMQKGMKAKWSLTGRSWRLQYSVVLSFGGTELKAYIVWKDKLGNEQRGPASLVFVKSM